MVEHHVLFSMEVLPTYVNVFMALGGLSDSRCRPTVTPRLSVFSQSSKRSCGLFYRVTYSKGGSKAVSAFLYNV